MLGTIPAEARVSASTQLVPHLAFRESIYQFPVVNDAEYIVLLKEGDTYPLQKEDYFSKVDKYSNSPGWEKIYEGNSTLVFRKKQ